MPITPPLFTSTFPDGTHPDSLQPSHWNAVSGLLARLFDGPDVDGHVLTRDAASNSGALWQELPTIAGPAGPQGPSGPAGPAGADGAQGAIGPPGPAPAGTGFVKVTNGVLDTPSPTINVVDGGEYLYLRATSAIDLNVGGTQYLQCAYNFLYPPVDNTIALGSPAARWSAGNFATSISVGTNPAQTGALRLPNNQGIYARNTANDTDYALVNLTGSHIAVLGNTLGATRLQAGTTTTALYIDTNGTTRWTITNSGQLRPFADSTYNIGDGALRMNMVATNRINSSLTSPGGIANGDWWVECVGTSPARVAAVKVRDGATDAHDCVDHVLI